MKATTHTLVAGSVSLTVLAALLNPAQAATYSLARDFSYAENRADATWSYRLDDRAKNFGLVGAAFGLGFVGFFIAGGPTSSTAGILGGLVGGWLAAVLFNSHPIDGPLDVSSIVVATVGAIIVVVVVGMFTGRRTGRGTI